VKFTSYERDGRMLVCYDGDAYRRVLAMQSSAEQRARAALALIRSECFEHEVSALERYRTDVWRAEVLDRVGRGTPARISQKSRRDGKGRNVWASLTYQRARMDENADAAAQRAIAELAAVDKTQLTEADLSAYNDAAIRVGASRWGATCGGCAADPKTRRSSRHADSRAKTCIDLIETRGEARTRLAHRCTYGIVWTNSRDTEPRRVMHSCSPSSRWSRGVKSGCFAKTAGG
jgi:hypothetical protein